MENDTIIGFVILGFIIIISSLIPNIGFFKPIGIIETNVTSSIGSDLYLQIASNKLNGYSTVNKFGASTLDTGIHPLTLSTHYRTPKTPKTLEVLSSDLNDNVLGSGARKVKISGLNSDWEEITQEVSLNGTTPTVLPIPMLRVYRWFVSESGVYANESVGSHEGTLTIREIGGGDLWSTIPISPFPVGQSQIGAYSVPKGKDAYLLKKVIFVDTSKSADIYFFKREYINDTIFPYSGVMRIVEREVGISGGYDLTLTSPNFLCSSPCDVGFMGLLDVGTAEASVEFEILLIDQ